MVYVDMDEVLCDFISGAMALHGITTAQLNPYRIKGTWELDCSLARFGRPMTKAEFWAPMNNNSGFWASLKPLPWFEELTGHLNQMFDTDWMVLSSPTDTSSMRGKADWLSYHLDFGPERFILSSRKWLLSRPGTVLIDDREETVVKFGSMPNGGRGILFPDLTNSAFAHASNPVPHVMEQLDALYF